VFLIPCLLVPGQSLPSSWLLSFNLALWSRCTFLASISGVSHFFFLLLRSRGYSDPSTWPERTQHPAVCYATSPLMEQTSLCDWPDARPHRKAVEQGWHCRVAAAPPSWIRQRLAGDCHASEVGLPRVGFVEFCPSQVGSPEACLDRLVFWRCACRKSALSRCAPVSLVSWRSASSRLCSNTLCDQAAPQTPPQSVSYAWNHPVNMDSNAVDPQPDICHPWVQVEKEVE
jgi:hypothetical protein